jgi:hypothetical protein
MAACPAGHHFQKNHGLVKPADGFFILGKDEKGNYWTSAYEVKGQWAKFEEQLKEFNTSGSE